MNTNTLNKLQAELERISGEVGPEAALWKIELIYRISVLESFRIILRNAPVNVKNTKAIIAHFRVMDSMFQSLLSERQYQLPYEGKQRKDQETAKENFSKIFLTIRRRFKSFKETDSYPDLVKNFIQQTYVCWFQYRQTFVEINLSED